MERDPLRFVWRTTRVLHLAAFALLLLALPLAYAAVDLVRVAIDEVISGRSFARAGTAPFLRLVITPPEALGFAPVVLYPGLPLGRDAYAYATIGALAATAAAAALTVLLIGILRSAIGAKAIAALRRAVLGALVEARPSARDEARAAASLAGESLGRENGFLGSSVLQPFITGGAIGLALVYALIVDWRLAAAVFVALGLIGLAWPGRTGALQRTVEARLTEGAGVRRGLIDLVRRLPALRAHGTGVFERERLAQDLGQKHEPVRRAERRLNLAAAFTVFASVLAPGVVVSVGAWLGLQGRATAGEVAAATLAALLAVVALGTLIRWRQALNAARPLFEELARALGALQSRGRAGRADASLPAAGALVAESVAAYDPASGARLAGLDLTIPFPAHVALTGEAGGGDKVLAALIGGELDPSMGRLGFGGVDLADVPPRERARRIAYAGGDTVLIGGNLRQNLLYGCPDPDAPDIAGRLQSAASAAGLDAFVHARGLSGTIDPARDPKLAEAVVGARRAVRAALAAEKLEGFVDPFDPQAYNAHATLAENILFGVPVGDTFREVNLPAHPFMRAILESEGLTKPLAQMGLSIATSMVEIFADIPDGHPLFNRFSFFSAAERGFYEDLVERQSERRRGAEPARDRERLISLSLRYVETRHRLGLLTDELQERVLSARAAFAKLLPLSLQPAIEFYSPEKHTAAASLQDNLLFGRIAHDRAGAEPAVLKLVRRVLTERGLDQDVFRVGLETRVDLRGEGLLSTEVSAIEVARCLVRRPDILVVQRALDGLGTQEAEAMVQRLRRALVGRGLVIATSNLTGRMDVPPFDLVLRFERGALVEASERRSRRAAEPGPEPALAAAVGS